MALLAAVLAPHTACAQEKEKKAVARERKTARSRTAKDAYLKRSYVSRYARINPRQLNAVDRARYAIAAILVKQEKYEEAIEELQRVIAKTPEEEVKSATYLRLGQIYQQHMNDPESAIEQYEKVTGHFRREAVRAMILACEELGDVPRAGDLLEKAADQAEEPLAKVEMLHQLADFYQRHGDDERAVAALRKIIESIPYEQAEQLRTKSGGGRPLEPSRVQIQDKVDKLIKAGRAEEAAKLKARTAEWQTRDKRRAEKKHKAAEAAKEKAMEAAKKKAVKKVEKLEKGR